MIMIIIIIIILLNERVLDKVTTILSLARIAIILAAQCDGSFATSTQSGIKGGWAAMTFWREVQIARRQWQLLTCELLALIRSHLAATSHTRIWYPTWHQYE